jgi:hypothetical protein
MIGFFGNPDGLRALATALTTAGTNVSTNASKIGGKVSALNGGRWTGGAATAFQGHWNGEYTDMVDLGLSASIVARVLNDLAASLDQANQIVLQAIGKSTLQSTVSMLTLNPGGLVTSTSAVAAAVRQATGIAQKAWALATSRLAGVSVPKIGTLTSPQQAAAWAQSTLAAPPTVTNLNLLVQDGTLQNNKRPPWMPPFDPALNPGGFVVEPGGPRVVTGPFPEGVMTLQLPANLNLSGIVIRQGGGGQAGGGSGSGWIWALLMAMAGLALFGASAALGGAPDAGNTAQHGQNPIDQLSTILAMSFAGDLRKIIKEAQDAGWRVVKTGEYWVFYPPDGSSPCRIAGTGHTSGRGLNNFKACLKRKGLIIP